MKKITYFLNITTYIATLLFYTLSVQAMDENYTQQISLAEEYNFNDCTLLQLPNEKLIDIFSYCLIHDENQIASLKNSIKGFVRISTTCKHFNTLLTFETIGEFCKQQYTAEQKNTLFLDLISATNDWTYEEFRFHSLILICAGADANSMGECQITLIRIPIAYNDIEFLEVMLQHKANPNLSPKECFKNLSYIQTKEMVKLLYKYGLDIHATCESHGYNILWKVIKAEYPPELMQFYLDNHVDAKLLDLQSGDCLFHKVIWNDNVNDRMKKTQLLLTIIPNMINHQNNDGNTPLDILQLRIKNRTKLAVLSQNFDQIISKVCDDFEQIITLLEQHGALEAKQLKASQK